MQTISMRLDKNRLDVIEFLAKTEKKDKTEAMKELLDFGRINLAVKYYSSGKASLEKASFIAGMSISDFLEELRKINIKSNVSLEDFEESLKTLKKIIKQPSN